MRRDDEISYIPYVEMDVDAFGEQAILHYQNSNAYAAMVDATGVGAGVPPKMMRAGCRAFRVMVGGGATTSAGGDGEFRCLRDQLYWQLSLWLKNDPGAMLPPDDEFSGRLLSDQLLALGYEVVHDVITVTDKSTLKRTLGYSPDEMEALLMTFAPQNNKPRIAVGGGGGGGNHNTGSGMGAVLADVRWTTSSWSDCGVR